MLKLAMTKLVNPELIRYDPILFNFMQVHRNEKYQAVILAKESKSVLSLIHNIYTKNNK